MIKFLEALRIFFPINLLFSHIKYNVVMLFYWFILFGIINQSFGMGLGIPYLFLSPEYLGSSNPLSFLLLGAGIGGFIMAYHIYSYIQLGPRYPFIATLSRPFYKFSANNSLIPTIFLINLSINIFVFQKEQEYVEISEILFNIFAMIGGATFFRVFALLYFLPTNKDLYKMTGKKPEEFHSESSNIQTTLHKHTAWYKAFMEKSKDSYYYLTSGGFRIRKSRSTAHYDLVILNKVFTQNHVNASIFEILLLITFVFIGLFRENEFLQLPAGVSMLMLLTILTMLVSALLSWFKKWTIPIIIILILSINYLGLKTNSFQFKSYAYGLSYNKEDLVDYTKTSLNESILTDSMIEKSYNKYTLTLENWKNKTGQKKPKLIILNTSGGGLRSASWTFKMLQELDSITHKEFSKQVQMISGASGGMIGAAYYRDLILMENDSLIENRLNKEYLKNISKDLLNRVTFTIPTNDLFLRIKKEEINGHEYTVDRGYEFEEQLKSNLEGAFTRTIGDYRKYEQAADVPTMIFTPTIINDGRRLLIGSQHHGYLQGSDKMNAIMGINSAMENVEYLSYFAENNPDDLKFSTVLRMSATFPYIMPMVSMPTNPDMYVMDAGIRDNYGSKITVRYLLNLDKWIKENTSGVIVVRVRDLKKDLSDENFEKVSFLKRLVLPFGNIYGNFPRVQDFNQDELYSALIRSIDYPIDVITYNLREDFNDKIALSWHLTQKEKEKINKAVNSPANKAATQKLLQLLGYTSASLIDQNNVEKKQ